jgi:succinate dehydrogenase / fumarate reductase cytochrome b subunit
MSLAINKENYLLHKLHSLSGIIPVGFFMIQHLTLNSFAIAGPEKFDGVIHFFETVPKHILLGIAVGGIWLPLLFHAIYGFFIANRGMPNLSEKAYKFRENGYYTYQRITGIFLFAFLLYHVISTSITKYITGSTKHIEYASWADKLLANYGLLLILYMLGTLAAAYHLSYGIWMFCIRWGITISEKSQARMQKVATGAFVGLTLLAWSTLGGFFIHKTPLNSDAVTTAAISTPVLSR